MSSGPDQPRTLISSVVDTHVREILAEAERASRALQQEVEEASVARGLELRHSAEREAEQIRQRAQQEADAYLEECRRRSEAFAAGRVARLQELSDNLLARGETIRGRLLEADELHRSLGELASALTAAARAASSEAARPTIDLPRLVADPEPPVDAQADAAPRPRGSARDAPSEPALARVRVISGDLPPLPRRPSRPASPSPVHEDPSSA